MRIVTFASVAVAALLAVPAPAGAATDRRPPRVTFTTESGSVVVGSPVGGGRVEGRATDDGSGVASVVVTFCGTATTTGDGWTCGSGVAGTGVVRSAAAALRCADGRRSCGWSAPVPAHPGRYLVVARATDRTGKAAGAGPIEILVA